MQLLGLYESYLVPIWYCNDDDTGEIILSWTCDVNDDNYLRCKSAEERDAKGRNIRVYKLQLPRALFYTSEEVRTLGGTNDSIDAQERGIGDRLADSYANYYLANVAFIYLI
jgi:agmatine deiminase